MPSFSTFFYVEESEFLFAEEYKGGLLIKGSTQGTILHIPGLPGHVAKSTADAFNAAMEAERKPVAAE